MPTRYESVCTELQENPRKWLVTGAAGFIGSHLAEKLLSLGQTVVGVDNFATGKQANLSDIQSRVGETWSKFFFFTGSVTNEALLQAVLSKTDYVLHQAALGSVTRSIEAPLPSHDANVTGFLTTLEAAKKAGCKTFVYASSSSIYGDSPTLPKREGDEGEVLSPYAATKAFNEVYAKLYSRLYGLTTVGLRYFNVFGARQDPFGDYAAVIPRWIENRLANKPCMIFGDGKTSRDFCYIDNVVQANILAATSAGAGSHAYNVACGEQLSLTDLYTAIDAACQPEERLSPDYQDFRIGDVRHSLADIGSIRSNLGYEPLVFAKQGLEKTVAWYKSART